MTIASLLEEILSISDKYLPETEIFVRNGQYLFVVGAARSHFANAGKMGVLLVDKPPRGVYS